MVLLKSKEECLAWDTPPAWEQYVDEDVRKYLQFLLEEIKYECDIVRDGFEGNLDALRAFIYAWDRSTHPLRGQNE